MPQKDRDATTGGNEEALVERHKGARRAGRGERGGERSLQSPVRLKKRGYRRPERSTRRRGQRGVSRNVNARLSRETGVELRRKKAKVPLKEQEALRDVQARQDEARQNCDGLKAPRIQGDTNANGVVVQPKKENLVGGQK